MINSPEMRRRANSLVNYLRDESTLPKRIQELAMIVTARATTASSSGTPTPPAPAARVSPTHLWTPCATASPCPNWPTTSRRL